jgi:tRNA A37 threonylcarbamoyladenosine dehydratase
MDEVRERDLRNVALFGAAGQLRLRSTRVVVVGGGGLGSPLVQHLALLGAGAISVVDDEELSETNRNRFIGARHSDPAPGTRKVDILVRMVREIDPSIETQAIAKALLSPEAFQVVRSSNWVFGCFDEDGPRAILNELCAAYDKIYVDLASDVPEPGHFGGRVVVSTSLTGCLRCLNILDQRDVREFFSTESELAAQQRIYGVDQAHLDQRGPSVSPMNGVVASLAAVEFMTAVTGMSKPRAHIEYRGHQAKVVPQSDRPNADCPICASRGRGALMEVERYLALDYLRERRAQKTAKG